MQSMILVGLVKKLKDLPQIFPKRNYLKYGIETS